MDLRTLGPRGFLAPWIRATLLGWVLGVVLIVVLALAFESVGVSNAHFPVGAGMGLGIGLLQARLLRGRIPRPSAWLGSSVVALAFPFLAFDLARLLGVGVPYSLYASVVAGGLILGAWQAFLLRQVSSRSAWWLGACALGWLLASGAVAIAGSLPRSPALRGLPGAFLYLAIAGSGGVLLGLVTGLALVRLLPAAPDAWSVGEREDGARP